MPRLRRKMGNNRRPRGRTTVSRKKKKKLRIRPQGKKAESLKKGKTPSSINQDQKKTFLFRAAGIKGKLRIPAQQNEREKAGRVRNPLRLKKREGRRKTSTRFVRSLLHSTTHEEKKRETRKQKEEKKGRTSSVKKEENVTLTRRLGKKNLLLVRSTRGRRFHERKREMTSSQYPKEEAKKGRQRDQL